MKHKLTTLLLLLTLTLVSLVVLTTGIIAYYTGLELVCVEYPYLANLLILVGLGEIILSWYIFIKGYDIIMIRHFNKKHNIRH